LPSLIHVVGVDLAFAAWGAAKNPIEVPGNCRSQKPAIGQLLTSIELLHRGRNVDPEREEEPCHEPEQQHPQRFGAAQCVSGSG
jgi:hypothetical protein